MIRVLVVDDDCLVTESLKTILEATSEIEVIATGHSAAEAVLLYLKEKPDILLSDIRMGNSTGIDAAKEILGHDHAANILLLTTFSDDEYIQEALSIGVKGYLIKQNLAAIIPAVKAVYNGQSVFGTEVVNKMTTFFSEPKIQATSKDYQLSEREEMILLAVANGKNNKEIAKDYYLSEGTVRNYISQLLDKLELRDRTQLAIFYYQHYLHAQ